MDARTILLAAILSMLVFAMVVRSLRRTARRNPTRLLRYLRLLHEEVADLDKRIETLEQRLEDIKTKEENDEL